MKYILPLLLLAAVPWPATAQDLPDRAFTLTLAPQYPADDPPAEHAGGARAGGVSVTANLSGDL